MIMKKYGFIISFVALLGILSPSFAYAEKVSIKDAISATADQVKNCTKVSSQPDSNDTVEVDLTNVALPLVYFFKPQSWQSYIFNRTTGSAMQVDYYACDATQLSEIQIQHSSLDGTPRFILSATSWILSWVNWLIAFVLKFVGALLITMVSQGQYITNPIVASAWPFIQGIANLGFIFALLYIAFATTFRLASVSTSVQKLLPRLLIAALLVNFSLVIGGLLIDMSRVVMAVEINLMGNGSVNGTNFGDKLIASTNALNQEIQSMKNQLPNNSFLAVMVRMSQGTFFLFLLTLGISVIAINLLIRYIALIILLMISPLAYLAFALPNVASYASAWWGMFIKWVLYGPIVLFFLLIIIRVQNIAPTLPQGPNPDPTSWTPFFNAILHFVIVIALFFVANTLGKKVAGVGSDTAMGFANSAGAWAKKNPKKAAFAALTLSGAPGAGLGAAALIAGGQMTRDSARDFYRDTTSHYVGETRKGRLFGKGGFAGVASTAAQIAIGPDRDKEGNRKPGEQNSAGSWAAGKITGYNPTFDKKIAEERKKQKAQGAAYRPSFEIDDLTKPSFVARLDDEQVKSIMEHGSDKENKAIGAAIAADKKRAIPEDLIKTMISKIDHNNGNHSAITQSISLSPKITQKLKGPELEKIMESNNTKVTENLLKSLAHEDKK